MKALVIGASGLIGNHVVRSLLNERIWVRTFQRGVTPAQNLEGLDVERFVGDVNEGAALKKALKGCDWVFHTAPYYPTNAFFKEQHVSRGLLGIQNFCEAVEGSAVNRIVYTSTLTTIGPAKNGGLADETCLYKAPCHPHPYFEVKWAMEQEVLRRAKNQKLPLVCVNPTGCVGPYELKPPHLCLVAQLLNQKIPALVDHQVNMVDAADVGKGHVLAAYKGVIGERYILGGVNTTVVDFVHQVCRLGGIKPPRFKAPLALALIPAYFSEIWGVITNSVPALPVLGLRFVQFGQHFSIQKATQDLGYLPCPLDSGLQKAITWFRQVGYAK